MSSPRRCVITGLGPITAIGIGKEAFWQGLLAEKSAIRPLRAFDASPYKARTAAEIPDFDPARFFPSHRLKRLDRYAQFAVASALLALEDAGVAWSPDSPNPRIGVSFGTALGGISNAEHQHARFVEIGPRAVHQTLADQSAQQVDLRRGVEHVGQQAPGQPALAVKLAGWR